MTGNHKRKRASPWKWVVGMLFVLLMMMALYVAVLVYPNPLFAHHQRAGGFRVYSDRVPSVDVEELVAEVAEGLAAIEHELGSKTYKVYLCHSMRRYSFFARLTRRTPSSQAIGLSAPGNIFVSMPRLAQLAAHRGGLFAHSRFEGSLAFAIVHEVAHFGVIDSLGPDASRSLPAWKSEGWADYQASLAGIRRDPDYDLAQRIDLLDDPNHWQNPRLRARRFFAWQLLIEYLTEARSYRFEDLSRPSVTESETWAHMRAWHRNSQPFREASREEGGT
ncbi:MAG: hypothetical protein GY769_20745 [bacterium]|nr:hypothetical protein [bacterium]